MSSRSLDGGQSCLYICEVVCFPCFNAIECPDIPYDEKTVLASFTNARREKREGDGGELEDQANHKSKKALRTAQQGWPTEPESRSKAG